MPQFIVFPFLALFAVMLLVAALTFTVAAGVPAFRGAAVTAPVAAFLLSPALLIALVPWIWGIGVFSDKPTTPTDLWVGLGAVTALTLTGCAFVAILATLAIRAILEFLPPWLSRVFGLRQNLLLQSTILGGGSLSILMLLGSSIFFIIVFRDTIQLVIAFGATGLLAAAVCVLAVLRLPSPECYQPKPLPAAIKRLLIQERRIVG
jgi:hypothetical protein